MNVTIKDDKRNPITLGQAIIFLRETNRFISIQTENAGYLRVYSIGTGRKEPEIAIYTGARSRPVEVAKEMSDALVMALTITDAL